MEGLPPGRDPPRGVLAGVERIRGVDPAGVLGKGLGSAVRGRQAGSVTCSVCGHEKAQRDCLLDDWTCRDCQVFYIFERCEIVRRRRTPGMIEVESRRNWESIGVIRPLDWPNV
ncbi:MAG: hypothetical protein ACYS7Y_28715 [Planctomycetota bacterium]